jgi:uncharacterized protein
VLTALAWALSALVVIVGLLWIFQRRLIYLPTQAVPDPPASVDEITFETEDGLSLSAWLVEADDPRATVVVFNGNAGNRAHRIRLGEALAGRGYSVFLTDYRGYGGNPGSPSEDGLARDARAAIAWASQRASGPIVLYGESLGAGVAIGLAAEAPPDGLILRSPFISLPEVASVHYRWLPASLLLHDRYPNLERIATIEAPVLVVAGSADRIVPRIKAAPSTTRPTSPRSSSSSMGSATTTRPCSTVSRCSTQSSASSNETSAADPVSRHAC